MKRVGDFFDTMFFEAELVNPSNRSMGHEVFQKCPMKNSGYTELQNWSCLCQCGNLYDLEMSQTEGIYIC